MAKRKKPKPDELDAETLDYMRRYEAMPDDAKIAWQRHNALKTLLNWRAVMKKAPHTMPGDQRIYGVPFYRERIRENQIRLLKLRVWRATGVKPGNG